MSNRKSWIIVILVIAWFLLIRFVFPRFGVGT
jgi:hypothetical protein